MVLVMTFPALFFNFTNLGLHEATVYFIGRKRISPTIVLGNALTVALIISIVACISLTIFREAALPFFLKDVPVDLWIPIIFLIPVTQLQGVLLSILRADLSFIQLNGWRILSVLVSLSGYSIVLFGMKGGLRGSIVVFILVSILMLVVACLLILNKVKLSIAAKAELIKEMVRYGSKSYLQTFLASMNYRFDVYLVAFFLRPEDVAHYGVAFAIAELPWFLPNAIGSVLFPTLSLAPKHEVDQMTARVSRVSFALTTLACLGTAIVVIPFIPLFYGTTYASSIPPVMILLPGIIAMSVHKILGRNFASQDRQQYTVIASLISFIIIIGLNLILTPSLGIRGTALSSTIGYLCAGLILLIFFLRDSRLPIQEVLFLKKGDLDSYWSRIKQRYQPAHKEQR